MAALFRSVVVSDVAEVIVGFRERRMSLHDPKETFAHFLLSVRFCTETNTKRDRKPHTRRNAAFQTCACPAVEVSVRLLFNCNVDNRAALTDFLAHILCTRRSNP
jgi:hypothetical protein